MNIETISIELLKESPYNPRVKLQPTDPEYKHIQRSISEFELVEPLVWNKRSGFLVGGHHRLQVLKDLGAKDVQVSVVDLDPDKEKALNVALNKISGQWDTEKLRQLFVDVQKNIDATISGFSADEIHRLVSQTQIDEAKNPDSIPTNAPTRAKRGDIWLLGNHRLVCGDATDTKDVELLFADKKASLVVTDPPYNVDYEGYTDAELKIKNDRMSDDNFIMFLQKAFENITFSLADHGSFYIFHPSRYQTAFEHALTYAQLAIRTQIIWVKNTFAWGHARYKFQHEPIFYGHHLGSDDRFFGDKTQSTVWEVAKPSANRLHPTSKPFHLLYIPIVNSSLPGEIVFDPFLGSGSTLIACEALGRVCYGLELDPKYCDVILARWEAYSGKQATKVEDLVAA